MKELGMIDKIDDLSWWQVIVLLTGMSLLSAFVLIYGGRYIYEQTGSSSARDVSCGLASIIRDIVPKPSLRAYEFEKKFCTP
jgi:hypothetical protein